MGLCPAWHGFLTQILRRRLHKKWTAQSVNEEFWSRGEGRNSRLVTVHFCLRIWDTESSTVSCCRSIWLCGEKQQFLQNYSPSCIYSCPKVAHTLILDMHEIWHLRIFILLHRHRSHISFISTVSSLLSCSYFNIYKYSPNSLFLLSAIILCDVQMVFFKFQLLKPIKSWLQFSVVLFWCVLMDVGWIFYSVLKRNIGMSPLSADKCFLRTLSGYTVHLFII